jgi:mevalonate kinase
MTTAYSAPCSAFLWGDWSVLVSKKAILVPINKRVTVGLKPSTNLDCSVYCWSDRQGEWILDEWRSAKIERVISQGWLYLSSLHDIIDSRRQFIQMCVFSDVPFGCGIHERAAMSLALAGCLNDAFGKRDFHSHEAEQIAAILESFWYPQISWAPIVCSSRSPNSPKLIVFDRTDDGGIDFSSISSGDETEIRRNLFLNESTFKIDLIDFDVAKIVALSHKLIAIDLDEVHKLYAQSLSLLCSIGFECLSKLLVSYISNLDYEKVGMMMNLHQDILSTCGLSSNSFNALLRTLRCESRILGVKPSCCLTTHPALIALVNGSPLEITQGLANLVQPISPFLAPTPGLTRIF